MQLILFIIAFISFYTSVTLNNLPHSCESEIYCYGPLLHDVQLSNLYPDSKTFVDLALKASPKEVLQAFDELKRVHENLTLDEIKSFVDKYFEEGDELETWNPPDWTPTPSIAGRVKDIKVKDWVLQLNHIWKTLSRKIKEDVHKNPDHYSLIYVPNGFVIPGGRFRELYYWDTYWIIKGLLLCDMKDTAKGVIENLLHLVEEVGFVPNGNRVYYRERSQPPLLTQMVDYYFQETGDVEFVKAAFPVLKKEMKWWLDNRSIMINYEGIEYLMFRYNAPSDGPRPESYREDIETASTCKDDTTCRSLKYTALKSGAESGWDFSSRWFIDGTHSCGNIKNIDTGNIIPVDLNSFLHKNFKILSSYQSIVGDKSDEFAKLSNKLQLSIDQVLFDENAGIWFDYDLKNMVRRKFFYASNLTPLWTKSYDISKRDVLSKSVLKYITTVQLQNYPGGTPSSLLNSGQQWDMPNAWPPLQSIVVYGLDSLDTPEAKNFARKLANTWVTSNYKAFASSSHMFEKDNCDKYLNTIHNTSDAVIKFDHNICINKTNIRNITFICRQDTYLCMEWNMVIDGNPVLFADDIKYLIESKASNNSDSLNTSVLWTEHGWSPGRKFCVGGLRRNTEYVLRLTPYFREVQIGQPELSSFITTYYGNESLEAISRIRVEDFSSNIGSLDGILKWEPTKDNVCQTDILMYKDGELGLISEKIVGESSYTMKELSYSSLYVVLLFTSVAKSESNKTQFSFMTPSCLQLNDNDLNKCVPDPPSNLSIVDKCTSFIISWDEPEVSPDFYTIIFQYDEEVNNFTVPGNVTVYTFEDHSDAFFYFIYMKAVGPLGESRSSFISEKFKCFNRKDMLQHPSSTDTGSGPSFNPTAILITVTLTFAIGVCFVIWFIYFCVRLLHNDIDAMLPEDSFRKDNLSKFKNVDETDEIIKEKTEIEGKVGIRDEYEVNRHQIQLCEILGHGEFGVVHRGVLIYDNKCTENVAVKTLRNRGNAEEKRQLEKEMEVMKSVGKHRNIVSLLGCCTHDMMIIVEYCSLGDLRKFLRKAWRLKSYTENAVHDKSGCKILSERRAFSNILYDHSGSETRYFHLFMMDLLSFARQIALGMAYLSKNRVVHRDLAARNVLLAEDMTAKIADFGLSRDVYERNIYMKRSTDRLPLRWMAIESLIYQVFSTKSDVWSYGILLWEIMTLGGCPYPSLQTSEVFRLLQQGYRMDRPKPCSQKIYDIMLRCWDSKPQNRPTFTQIVTDVEDLMKCATNRSYLELSAFQYKRHLDKGSDIN